MVELLKQCDQSLFLILNGWHSTWLDPIVYKATNLVFWIPVYLVFLFLLIRKYKWNILVVIVFLALTILMSDQMTNLVKDLSGRLRPSHEPGLPVHLVYAYKGGAYGFYSAHASNFSAMAVFIMTLLGKKYRYWYSILFLMVILVSYTRIYLGVHYPGDVIAGLMTGTFLGWLGGKACSRAIRMLGKRKESSFQ